MEIDAPLVSALICDQFPQWRGRSVAPVSESGWDNRTFRLGPDMVVRMPSAERYVSAISKEQTWLPRLKAHLPLTIPEIVGIGAPGLGYPWPWSIRLWIEGEPCRADRIGDEAAFAAALAGFLRRLQSVDARTGPPAGEHNFHRGGDLAVYDPQMRQALARLADGPARAQTAALWERALASRWQWPPVWVHGDLAASNLLVKDGRLQAVIDFGQLGAGDPACDLAIAWTLFTDKGRQVFRDRLALDDETWSRAMGWVAWKAVILATGVAMSTAANVADAGRILGVVLADEADR